MRMNWRSKQGVNRLLRTRDFYAGGLMVLIGSFAAAIAPTYGLGTLMRMGSGVFPIILGVALIIVGFGIVVSGVWSRAKWEEQDEDILSAVPKKMDWRGWGCVLGGPIIFVILGEHFGLIPAAFGCVFVSILGDRKSTLKEALVLSTCVSVVGAFLFVYLMQMPFPVVTW